MVQSNPLDKFYTHPLLAKKCVATFNKLVNHQNDQVLEVSAGNGSFSSLVPKCHAYDIEPEKEGIMKQDFLDSAFDLNRIYKKKGLHFIGNPPFKQALLKPFLKKITDHPNTKSISYILPARFNRYSTYNSHFPKNFHLIHSTFCDEFVEFGKDKKVNCVFQVWVKKDEPRALHPVEQFEKQVKTSPHFEFVNTKAEADFIIGNQKQSGMVLPKTTELKRRQSGYYIKIHSSWLKIFFQLLVDYEYQLVPCDKREFIACSFVSKGEVKYSVFKLMETLSASSKKLKCDEQ